MSGSIRFAAVAIAIAAATYLAPSANAAPVSNPAASAALASSFEGNVTKVQRNGRGFRGRRGGGGGGAFRGRSFRGGGPAFRAPRAPSFRGGYVAPRRYYAAPRRAYGPGPRYYRRGPGWGRGIAIGAGVLAGAVLLSEAARAGYRRSGAWERCAADFVSFDFDTGTIVTYDGDVILCPYLN